MDERLDRIGNKARRRIIRGDPLPDVVTRFQSQGLPKPQIETVVGAWQLGTWIDYLISGSKADGSVTDL